MACSPGQVCAAGICAPRQWVTQPTTNPPGTRASHAAAYDTARDRLVVFGGEDFVSGAFRFLSDTWEYSPATNTWTAPNVTAPPARALAAMAYDPVRGVSVLFGGTNDFSSTNFFSDTWEWNGSSWRQATTTTGPSGRRQAQLAWDGNRQRIVLHGGYDSSNAVMTDTWEWNGTAWTQRTGIGTGPARAAGALVFDSARNVLVLTAGLNTIQATSTDLTTWELGASWAMRTTSGTAPARYATATTYDPGINAVLVVGGTVNGASVAGTYTLSNASWSFASQPANIGFASAVFDPLRGRVYVFGGLNGAVARTNQLLVY